MHWLLNAVPSLDPFLLREHLRNNKIEVAPTYFAISEGDQTRMYEFVKAEMSKLVLLAGGGEEIAEGKGCPSRENVRCYEVEEYVV